MVGAELPRSGELWLEVSPSFESWSERFDGGDSLSDGRRGPLHSDYGGPLADRLYPGPELVAASVNRGADSLGFAPLEAGEVSLGSLEFGDLTAGRTVLPVRAVLGITDGIALEGSVEFAQTRTDASFRYDSTGATLAPAPLALQEGGSYLDGLASARSTLQSRIEGGELPPEEEAAARDLLDDAGAFAAVLGRKLESGSLLPLAGSRPGDEMAGRASALRSAFQSFDIQAPELGLAQAPGPGALSAFLGGPTMEAEPLRGTSMSLQPAAADLGLRVGILDTFRSPDDPEADAPDPPGGLQLRTTAGLRLHWPLAEPDAVPFLTPTRLLDTPVGDGARVLEAALHQDVAYGRFRAAAGVGYGRRMADDVTLRVHDPGRPFPLAAARRELRRDPGDYLWIRFSPRLAVNSFLSMGVDYAFWRQDPASFSASTGAGTGTGSAGVDPADLGRETGSRRHSAGIGVRYRAGSRDATGAGPLEAAFTYRLAVAGSGGRTPAANVMGVRIRVPVSLGLF